MALTQNQQTAFAIGAAIVAVLVVYFEVYRKRKDHQQQAAPAPAPIQQKQAAPAPAPVQQKQAAPVQQHQQAAPVQHHQQAAPMHTPAAPAHVQRQPAVQHHASVKKAYHLPHVSFGGSGATQSFLSMFDTHYTVKRAAPDGGGIVNSDARKIYMLEATYTMTESDAKYYHVIVPVPNGDGWNDLQYEFQFDNDGIYNAVSMSVYEYDQYVRKSLLRVLDNNVYADDLVKTYGLNGHIFIKSALWGGGYMDGFTIGYNGRS